MLFVVGLLDQSRVISDTQRRGLELLQTFDSFADNAVFRTFFGRQVKQNNRNFDVDQMRSNLRTHHARAQDGDFGDIESRHS